MLRLERAVRVLEMNRPAHRITERR
jgi:hypothetical protein